MKALQLHAQHKQALQWFSTGQHNKPTTGFAAGSHMVMQQITTNDLHMLLNVFLGARTQQAVGGGLYLSPNC